MQTDVEPCPTCHGQGVLPPIKVCADPFCRKPFRWQEGRAKTESRHSKGVIFCSSKCARRKTDREWKRKKRTESEQE